MEEEMARRRVASQRKLTRKRTRLRERERESEGFLGKISFLLVASPEEVGYIGEDGKR